MDVYTWKCQEIFYFCHGNRLSRFAENPDPDLGKSLNCIHSREPTHFCGIKSLLQSTSFLAPSFGWGGSHKKLLYCRNPPKDKVCTWQTISAIHCTGSKRRCFLVFFVGVYCWLWQHGRGGQGRADDVWVLVDTRSGSPPTAGWRRPPLKLRGKYRMFGSTVFSGRPGATSGGRLFFQLYLKGGGGEGDYFRKYSMQEKIVKTFCVVRERDISFSTHDQSSNWGNL